jgi:L-ascorbate metabolism protein UlaG (beta-lactamase superfamily)
MKSGCIVPQELKGQNIAVFSTHGHQDHYNKSYFDWDDNISGIEYIFCHRPDGISDEYDYLPVHSETEIDGMKIYVNNSTDGGGGFLVEVDGLTIFHMGDHANGDDELSEEFTREIDLIAEMNKEIDILFGPIRGCSLGTPSQVKTGIYYTLEKLQPELFVPMHAGSFSAEYKSFVEQAQRDGMKQPMKYMMASGDRFHYYKGEEVVRN